MAILELQNAITLMKNLMNGLKVKLEPAEERVKELEDRWAEIIQSKILEKIENKCTEIKDLQDINKQSKIHIIRV